MFFIYLYIFSLGAVFASFINVCALRYKTNSSLLNHSICPKCNTQLNWYDLIPIVSYIHLKGKCRYCHKTISVNYIIVELLSGIIFCLIFYRFSFNINTIVCFIVFLTLLYSALVDLNQMIIPDKTHFILLTLSFFIIILKPECIYNKFIGSIIVSLPLFIIATTTKEIGLGDVKLMFSSGMLIGPHKIILSIILASILGALWGLINYKNYNSKQEIPFAPFLSIAILIAILYGENIFLWYYNLFY